VDGDIRYGGYLAKILKRFDYQIYTATTAREALESVITVVPSLVILSLNLKDMDSFKFMQGLKKNPMTAGIPFIMLTRQDDQREETKSFLSGALDCLSVPVSVERLYRSVQTVVETTPRTDIRIRMLLPVKINKTTDAERTCMLDISERGLFLASSEPSAVSTSLNLLINLNGRLIPAEAVVLHKNENGEGPYLQAGMGLQFIKISPPDRAAIQQFIKEEILRGISPDIPLQ